MQNAGGIGKAKDRRMLLSLNNSNGVCASSSPDDLAKFG
jgi:hypothetical protein